MIKDRSIKVVNSISSLFILKFSFRPSFSPLSGFFHRFLKAFFTPFLVFWMLSSICLIFFSVKGSMCFSMIFLNDCLIFVLSSFVNPAPLTTYEAFSIANRCSSMSRHSSQRSCSGLVPSLGGPLLDRGISCIYPGEYFYLTISKHS